MPCEVDLELFLESFCFKGRLVLKTSKICILNGS